MSKRKQTKAQKTATIILVIILSIGLILPSMLGIVDALT